MPFKTAASLDSQNKLEGRGNKQWGEGGGEGQYRSRQKERGYYQII